jgi:hypothetical protein
LRDRASLDQAKAGIWELEMGDKAKIFSNPVLEILGFNKRSAFWAGIQTID